MESIDNINKQAKNEILSELHQYVMRTERLNKIKVKDTTHAHSVHEIQVPEVKIA